MEKFVSVDSTTYMWVTLRKSNTNILEFYLICFKIRYRSNNHKKDLRSLVKSKSESLWFILLYCFLDRQLTEASAINKKRNSFELSCLLIVLCFYIDTVNMAQTERQRYVEWCWFLVVVFVQYIPSIYILYVQWPAYLYLLKQKAEIFVFFFT